MALSGSISTNSYEQRYYKLSWSASQSIPNNTSTINWTLTAEGAGWWAERTLRVVIAGNTVVDKTARVERWDGTVASGSLTVSHDAAGNFSFSASIQAAVYYSTVNLSGSSSFTLDTIPRAASITSAQDFNDEENPILYYSNPAGNAVTSLQACISLTGAVDDIAYREISKTGTSYTFNLTEAERKVLRKAISYGNYTRTVYFFLATTIGGTVYRVSTPKTFSLKSFTPTLNTSYKDVGAASVALTGDSNKIIKYFNYLEVATGGAARKEATVASNKITCGSKSIDAASGYLENVESDIITFSVTDSRGWNTTISRKLTMIPYIKLTCNLEGNAELAADNSATATITISGKYFSGSFGAANNSLQVMYRYSVNGGTYSSWRLATNPSIDTTGSSYTVTTEITGLNYKDTCTVEAKATDKVTTITSNAVTIKTVPVFDWSENDFNFNVPIAINNEQMTDYVVEQGTEGIWSYRKWSSGVAELWGAYGFNNVGIPCIDAWGSWYSSKELTLPDFPFEFTGIPAAQYTWRNEAGYAGFIQYAAPTKTSAGKTYIARPTAVTIYGYISMHLIGKWR